MFNIIMKEIEILNIINNTLSNNSLIGEDCAFLEDIGVFITQDTLCEGVHFDLKYTDFYFLAQKTAAVNISDLCANLSKPKYISISISFPANIDNKQIKQFYKGINDFCKKYNIVVSGGDLTGSKSGIVISVCAIGVPYEKNQPKVSRGYAKENQIICVTKDYGSSAYALYCLQNKIKCSENILKTHISPKPDVEISKMISTLSCNQIAMMDSSDGLCDALYKMAKASDKTFEIDFDKVPYNKEIEKYKGNYKDLILWGGEDYGLVFCLDEKDFSEIKEKSKNIKAIGTVKSKNKQYYVKIDDLLIDEEVFFKKSYNHYKK